MGTIIDVVVTLLSVGAIVFGWRRRQKTIGKLIIIGGATFFLQGLRELVNAV